MSKSRFFYRMWKNKEEYKRDRMDKRENNKEIEWHKNIQIYKKRKREKERLINKDISNSC